MDEQARLPAAADDLPDWLWEELLGLVADYYHMP